MSTLNIKLLEKEFKKAEESHQEIKWEFEKKKQKRDEYGFIPKKKIPPRFRHRYWKFINAEEEEEEDNGIFNVQVKDASEREKEEADREKFIEFATSSSKNKKKNKKKKNIKRRSEAESKNRLLPSVFGKEEEEALNKRRLYSNINYSVPFSNTLKFVQRERERMKAYHTFKSQQLGKTARGDIATEYGDLNRCQTVKALHTLPTRSQGGRLSITNTDGVIRNVVSRKNVSTATGQARPGSRLEMQEEDETNIDRRKKMFKSRFDDTDSAGVSSIDSGKSRRGPMLNLNTTRSPNKSNIQNIAESPEEENDEEEYDEIDDDLHTPRQSRVPIEDIVNAPLSPIVKDETYTNPHTEALRLDLSKTRKNDNKKSARLSARQAAYFDELTDRMNKLDYVAPDSNMKRKVLETRDYVNIHKRKDHDKVYDRVVNMNAFHYDRLEDSIDNRMDRVTNLLQSVIFKDEQTLNLNDKQSKKSHKMFTFRIRIKHPNDIRSMRFHMCLTDLSRDDKAYRRYNLSMNNKYMIQFEPNNSYFSPTDSIPWVLNATWLRDHRVRIQIKATLRPLENADNHFDDENVKIFNPDYDGSQMVMTIAEHIFIFDETHFPSETAAPTFLMEPRSDDRSFMSRRKTGGKFRPDSVPTQSHRGNNGFIQPTNSKKSMEAQLSKQPTAPNPYAKLPPTAKRLPHQAVTHAKAYRQPELYNIDPATGRTNNTVVKKPSTAPARTVTRKKKKKRASSALASKPRSKQKRRSTTGLPPRPSRRQTKISVKRFDATVEELDREHDIETASVASSSLSGQFFDPQSHPRDRVDQRFEIAHPFMITQMFDKGNMLLPDPTLPEGSTTSNHPLTRTIGAVGNYELASSEEKKQQRVLLNLINKPRLRAQELAVQLRNN